MHTPADEIEVDGHAGRVVGHDHTVPRTGNGTGVCGPGRKSPRSEVIWSRDPGTGSGGWDTPFTDSPDPFRTLRTLHRPCRYPHTGPDTFGPYYEDVKHESLESRTHWRGWG